MTRFTKILVAAAVVATFGFASQSAMAQSRSVIVQPNVNSYPKHLTAPYLLPHTTPYTVNYPMPIVLPQRPIFVQPSPILIPPVRHHDHDYLVLTRTSPFGGWQMSGRFETRRGAEIAERQLEWRGIPTRIVRACDWNGW